MTDISTSSGFHLEEDGEMNLYRKDATTTIFFKIVYDKSDVDSEEDLFKPIMAHQVFGESESIFGYRSVSINLHYHHNSAQCYINVKTSGEVTATDIYKPDDIMGRLEKWLPNGFTTDKNKFIELVENEKHDVMFGTVLKALKYKLRKEFGNHTIDVVYNITKCDITDKNFQEYHNRLETFLVWYIDGANSIDLNDERWMIYYVYEEFEHPVTKETYRSPIGYCTVYNFFAYPDKIRPRISQFFIIPLHQRRGIGSYLYKVVVEDIKEMENVVDITVEEPTPQFQRIRDYYDAITIYKEVVEKGIGISKNNQSKIFEILRKNKICKKQSHRIYDILGCYQANKWSPTEYRKYLFNIKRRIIADIEKETRGSKRLCSSERASLIADSMGVGTLSETEYKKYVDEIQPTINYLIQHIG